MNRFTITRRLDAPVDQVWKVVGKPGVSPGPGVDVKVEDNGAPDGTGLKRAVKLGHHPRGDHQRRARPYRALPHDQRGTGPRPPEQRHARRVTERGTQLSWDVQFQPVVPGTGWLIAAASRRTLNHVVDVVAASTQS